MYVLPNWLIKHWLINWLISRIPTCDRYYMSNLDHRSYLGKLQPPYSTCCSLICCQSRSSTSLYCVTFAESEPYCHSILFVCLSRCLSVILRPTAYHDWSITTKFGRQVYTCPRTRVSFFGSHISHTFAARGKNMQNLAYFQRQPINAYSCHCERDASCHMTCASNLSFFLICFIMSLESAFCLIFKSLFTDLHVPLPALVAYCLPLSVHHHLHHPSPPHFIRVLYDLSVLHVSRDSVCILYWVCANKHEWMNEWMNECFTHGSKPTFL